MKYYKIVSFEQSQQPIHLANTIDLHDKKEGVQAGIQPCGSEEASPLESEVQPVVKAVAIALPICVDVDRHRAHSGEVARKIVEVPSLAELLHVLLYEDGIIHKNAVVELIVVCEACKQSWIGTIEAAAFDEAFCTIQQ